jgi:transposase InsO family protein
MTRPTTELAHLFRQLKAPAAARALPKLADRARAEEWSYEQFAAVLLKTETDSRDSHGGQARIRLAGEDVGRGHVERLMREHGICGAKRRGKPWRTTRPDPLARRRPDLVGRQFSASAPNQLWVADFTYGRCWEGVVFFSFVIDVYSRRVVGWQFASHMRTTLVLDALRMALAQRGSGADVQLVHHSDRGSQPGLNRSSQQLSVS